MLRGLRKATASRESRQLQEDLDKVRTGKVVVQDKTPQQLQHDQKNQQLADSLRSMAERANRRDDK